MRRKHRGELLGLSGRDMYFLSSAVEVQRF
ncbi:Hypothetical protein LUCI_1182 [Lucifera butyrica]|uniref:Uncharacterized protein n=1 Tax=Lucifera butyrica TaxID=1351585 RepID=A0A498R3I5_9FIRM|nr:Hypothetical protein LUCI_1182 [Lucifera butyrica]